MSRTRLLIGVGLAVALAVVLFTSGCELLARIVGAGVATSYEGCAREPMLAVGDSLRLTARVRRADTKSMSFNPLDGVDLYTSLTHPKAFAWRVEIPPGHDPRAGLEGSGNASVSPSGTFTGTAPGYVFIYAKSAGRAGFSRYLIVPRVLRMSVAPQDTTVRVGDTVTVRLDAEMDAPWNGRYVVWQLIGRGSGAETAEPVSPDSEVEPFGRKRSYVITKEGTALIEVCLAGTHRDTVRLRSTAR